jgi:hypothetical protein
MKVDPEDDSPDFSPTLRHAIAEMREKLRRYDIAGVIMLFNGAGHAEYAIQITEPTWSALQFDPAGIRFKSAMKTGGLIEKKKSAMTINMLVLVRDIAAKVFDVADKMVAMLSQHMEIDAGELKKTPGGEVI